MQNINDEVWYMLYKQSWWVVETAWVWDWGKWRYATEEDLRAKHPRDKEQSSARNRTNLE